MRRIWTMGHSTRSLEEFVETLKSYDIETVADVRTVPRSRKNPKINRQELENHLSEVGIEYIHEKDLGGLRKPLKDSPNSAWHNDSFRGFADYMQTDGFQNALNRLAELAAGRRTAIMCAELLPWRCHRSLIADVLMTRGFDVIEIFDKHKSQPHKMTSFAVAQNGRISYPATVAEANDAD